MQFFLKLFRIFLIVFYILEIGNLESFQHSSSNENISNTNIQAPSTQLLPPTHIRGRQITNQFVAQTDLINEITWKPPTEGIPPVAYQIYRNSELTDLAANIPADAKLKFKDHNRKENHLYKYFLVSVDAAGNKSNPILILFKGPHVHIKRLSSKKLVSIEITPVNPSVAAGYTIQFTAIGLYRDNSTQDLTNVVTWSSSNHTVAHISNGNESKGLASGLIPGTTQIEATLDGISGSTTLTVTNATLLSIEVTPLNPLLAAGFTTQFTAIGLFSDDSIENLTESVTWVSSNTSVAIISNALESRGLATGLQPGTTQIEASTHGITGSTTLTATSAVLLSIEVTSNEAALAMLKAINPSVPVGFTEQFTAIGLFSDDSIENLTESVNWTSSNPVIASISNASQSKGLATALQMGTTQIIASLNGITGSTTLTVTSAILLSIDITPENPSVAAGYAIELTAMGLFSDDSIENLTESVTWTSSNPAIAFISNDPKSKGQATGLRQGTTLIKAISHGVTGSITLTVTPAILQSIQVTPLNPSVAAGYTTQFTAIGMFSDESTENITESVTWETSNPDVAFISNDPLSEGEATGLKPGTSQIKAISHGISGFTTLTVTTANLLSILVTPLNPSVAAGYTEQFTAIGFFSDNSTENLTEHVTWETSNPAVAFISNDPESKGEATGLLPGTSLIKAISHGVTGSTTLTVTEALLVAIQVNPVNPIIAAGYTEQFTAIGLFSDNSMENLTESVTWETSNPSVASISNDPKSEGLATGKQQGTSQIKAISHGISDSTTLTITEAVLVAIVVTPVNPKVAAGYTNQFTAIGFFSDNTSENLTKSVIWTSSDSAVAFISNDPASKGQATGLQSGSTTIAASSHGVIGSTTLTVTPAILESIQVTPDNSIVAAGYTEHFTAIGLFSDNSTEDLTESVTWTSSDSTVAVISNDPVSKGLATALKQGTAVINAISHGITGSTTLTVTSAVLESIQITPVNPKVAAGYATLFTAIGLFSDNTAENLTESVLWTSSNSAVAVISNDSGSHGLATGLQPGITLIKATLNGVSGSRTLTVTAAILEFIQVTPSNPSVAAGYTTQFTAIGLFSDKSTEDLTESVVWTTSDSAIAFISNDPINKGLATALKQGTSVINAISHGKTGSTTLTVTSAALESIQITPATPIVAAGYTIPFTAIGLFSDNSTEDLTESVTWTTSDATVAIISNDPVNKGLAKGLTPGTSEMQAISHGITGSTILTVTPAILESIQVTPANPTVAAGYTNQFTAIGLFSDNSTEDLTNAVTWTTSNSAVAVISNDHENHGLATGLQQGSSLIQAILNNVSGSATLTVTTAILESIQVTPVNPTVAAGYTIQLTAIGVFSDNSTEDLTNNVTWATSDSNIAAISNDHGSHGLAMGLQQGTSLIGATLNNVSDSITLTVTPAMLLSIDVMPFNPTVAAGYTTQFTAIGFFSDNSSEDLTQTVTWTSSNANVAVISNGNTQKGLANALQQGTASITATSHGVFGSAVLTVSPAVLLSIDITPANPTIAAGFVIQFTAIGFFSDDSTEDLTKSATWKTSNPTVASVSNDPATKGVANGLQTGTSLIEAISHGVTGSVTLKVTPATLLSIELEPINPLVAAGYPIQFTATGDFSDGTTKDLTAEVTWTSSVTSVAQISNTPGSKGLASTLQEGRTTITAMSSGISKSTVVTVTTAELLSIQVTPSNAEVAAGFTVPYTATGLFSDNSTEDLTNTVTWKSSNEAVAVISNGNTQKGLATGLTSGTTQITATSNGITNSTTLTVTPAILLSLIVTPVNSSVAAGFTVQFSAIGTFSDSTTEDLAQQATWESTNTSAAVISNSPGSKGLATSLSVGSTNIKAIIKGISNTTTLTVTSAVLVSIAVAPPNPTILAGTTIQFTATGTFSDSTTENITTEVTWNSSNANIASVSNAAGSQGVATGLLSGSTQISANSGSVSGATLLTVTCPVITITTTTLPSAEVPVPYSATIQTAGGVQPIQFSLVEGRLPPGLDLSSAGVISGTPNGANTTSNFTIKAVSSCGQSAFQAYKVVTRCPGPQIVNGSPLPSGKRNVFYSVQIVATGVPPYTFAISTGSLPAGLSINAATGLISGTPTSTGTSTFRIDVTAPCGFQSRQFMLTINK